jgi:hypothetical protein
MNFKEIQAKYPYNFTGTVKQIDKIPNVESFVGQVFSIRSILRRNYINCDLSTIGYVDTDEKFAYGIPTHGRFYVYNKLVEAKGCPFPPFFRQLIGDEKEFNVLMLYRSWNEPEKIVMRIIINNKVSSVGRATGKKLLHKMFRYSLILKLTKIEASYEALNIYERWLIGAANDYQETDQDYIFDKRKVERSHPITIKMSEELKEKGLPQSILDEFLKLSEEWLTSTNDIKHVDIHMISNVMKLVSSNGIIFLYTFPQEVLLALLKRGTVEQLACVCLRYACILQQAQQWAKTNEIYRILVHDFGASLEGFASPLNSRIILQSETANFCSLFPDVDTPFGSVGSFFEQDLVGKVATVNPPYLGSVFDDILTRIKLNVQKAIETNQPMLLTIGVSDWLDHPLLIYLENSEYLKYKYVLKRGEYTFVDTKFDSYVPTTFANIEYVLGVNRDDDVSAIKKYFNDCRLSTIKLVELKKKILSRKGLDFSNLGIRMNNFNAKFIADNLRVYGRINDIMDIFKEVPSSVTLSVHLLADAFVNLDPRNTMKYNKQEVFDYVNKKAKLYLE